jgi:1,4-dihydroxy-2-naphthoate octaprenyltransferase
MAWRAWVQASRPLAQANIAVPLLFGQLVAFAECGRLDVGLVVLAHLFGIFDQLFIVYANDLADEEGDRAHTAPTPFSGGSRVLVEGKLSRRALSRAAIAMALAMLATCVVAAIWFARPAAPLGWALAVVLLWAYSYPPLRGSYHGWGEALQGLGVGVALPLLGFYLQCGDIRGFPWAALAPAFLLGVASNIATGLPDHEADMAVGKHTWSVRYGPERARKHCLQIVAIATLMTPLVLADLPQLGLVALEAGPLLALGLALVVSRAAVFRPTRFVFAVGLAINLAFVGWIVALAIRPPWGW